MCELSHRRLFLSRRAVPILEMNASRARLHTLNDIREVNSTVIFHRVQIMFDSLLLEGCKVGVGDVPLLQQYFYSRWSGRSWYDSAEGREHSSNHLQKSFLRNQYLWYFFPLPILAKTICTCKSNRRGASRNRKSILFTLNYLFSFNEMEKESPVICFFSQRQIQ